MANFVTVAYGLVTRESSTNGEKPALTVSDDPWLDVSGMNPRPVPGDHFDGTDYTLDHTALTVAQAAKIASLRDACGNHIKYLGFPMWFMEDNPTVYYVYASETKDQSNLHIVLDAADIHENDVPQWFGRLWCAYGQDANSRVADGTDWDRRDHTVSQIRQVSSRMQHHIEDAQDELQIKTNDALAATTVNDVNAVVWQQPNS